jgi:hypothetical protein
VQLPDALYEQVEGLAARLRMSVPELLSAAAELMVRRQANPRTKPDNAWRFPEGYHLGAFRAPVEDWRLLANEAPD